jgi:hypothetical protein
LKGGDNLERLIKDAPTIKSILYLKCQAEKHEKEFEEIWKLYPNKKGKQQAKRYFEKLLREKYTIEHIKRAISRYSENIKDKDKKYIQQGGTFFGRGIYDYFDDNYELMVKDEHKKVIPEPEIKIDFNSLDDYGKLIHYLKSIPYDEYLETEHWKHFRNEALKWAGHKCQLCSKEDTTLVIHHKTYENRGRETFNDVIVLCEDCHKLVHGKQ